MSYELGLGADSSACQPGETFRQGYGISGPGGVSRWTACREVGPAQWCCTRAETELQQIDSSTAQQQVRRDSVWGQWGPPALVGLCLAGFFLLVRRKKNPRKYIFPEREAFPVYDPEHEWRALTYVKAGRIAEEDVPAVLRYLRTEAMDPGVRAAAREKGLAKKARKVIRGRLAKLRGRK